MHTNVVPVYSALSLFMICILAVPGVAEDIGISDNYSSTDNQFLFMMNQYWIPDMYEIKGRIDGSISYDIPDMLNISVEYGKNRLLKNLNETYSYNVSPDLTYLRSAYDRTVSLEVQEMNLLPALNRSDPGFSAKISQETARFSLYGAWLEYQVMQRYDVSNRTYPELATVPADQFFSIMGNLT